MSGRRAGLLLLLVAAGCDEIGGTPDPGPTIPPQVTLLAPRPGAVPPDPGAVEVQVELRAAQTSTATLEVWVDDRRVARRAVTIGRQAQVEALTVELGDGPAVGAVQARLRWARGWARSATHVVALDPFRRALRAFEAASAEPARYALDPYGGIAEIEGRVTVSGDTPADRARAFVAAHGDLFAIANPTPTLVVSRVQRTDDGEDVVRFAQRHLGRLVYGAEVIVQLEGEAVVSVTAQLLHDLPPEPAAAVSLEAALAELGRGLGGPEQLTGEPQLIWYSPALAAAPADTPWATVLGWRLLVDVQGQLHDRIVDSATGRTVLDLAIEQTCSNPAPRVRVWNVSGTGRDNCYFARTLPFGAATRSCVEGRGCDGSASAADQRLFDWAFDTYRFYARELCRLSYDGDDGRIVIMSDYEHLDTDGDPLPNASWSRVCRQARFSSGYASLDVMGHELTHGLVQETAGLVYRGQSGALNESYADVFGELLDGFEQTGALVMGVDHGPTTGAVRDMCHPQAFQQPDTIGQVTPSSCAPTEDNDWCGVHLDSGIINKVAAFLALGSATCVQEHGARAPAVPVNAIGGAKVLRLWYDVLRYDLSPQSNFEIFRRRIRSRALRYARLDLYGFTPRDRCEITNAFAVVGMNDSDADCDGIGDLGDPDDDDDGVLDAQDNCPIVANPLQADLEGDGLGDLCDDDLDGDRVPNDLDNCALVANVMQADADGDGRGDACDDLDGDGLPSNVDNCPRFANVDQADLDGDGLGDVCDPDEDGDGLPNTVDLCDRVAGTDNSDADGDGRAPPCDNCPRAANAMQRDADRDGVGDACDDDVDGDGIAEDGNPNADAPCDGSEWRRGAQGPFCDDNCPTVYNPRQRDGDGNGRGFACDPVERADDGIAQGRTADAVWDRDATIPVREIRVPLPVQAFAQDGLGDPTEPRLAVRVGLDAPDVALDVVNARGEVVAQGPSDETERPPQGWTYGTVRRLTFTPRGPAQTRSEGIGSAFPVGSQYFLRVHVPADARGPREGGDAEGFGFGYAMEVAGP